MEVNRKRCKVARRDPADSVRWWEIELRSKVSNIFIGNIVVLTDAADTPPAPSVMLTADSMTCSEKPKGFLYSATVLFEPDNGANASC